MAQNVSMEQLECCSVANVRLAPLGFCLKQSACQLSIMLEKQICSGKIIVSFHIQVYITKTLALYSQKSHHNSFTKTSWFKVYADIIVHCKSHVDRKALYG
jgi:hypothetical protein